MEQVLMNEIEALKKEIEVTRRALDASVMVDDFEIYYEKSKKLDKLIEKYIEMNTECE